MYLSFSLSLSLAEPVFAPFYKTDFSFVPFLFSRLSLHNQFRQQRCYFIFTTRQEKNAAGFVKISVCVQICRESYVFDSIQTSWIFITAREKRNRLEFSLSVFFIMSLETNLDREVPSSTASSTKRNFLIVPSFNPERRHSWGNVVSHPKNVMTSLITITANADSILRWDHSIYMYIIFFNS